MSVLPVTIAIPTYGREQVLLDTIQMFLGQKPAVAEILVVDQTHDHEHGTIRALADWDQGGKIRWICLEQPSQPVALNVAIREALQPFLIFVDDDIQIDPEFAAAHYKAFEDDEIWAVAGQVLQPGEEEDSNYEHQPQAGLLADVDFRFRSGRKCFIQNGMSGNLCVRRNRALEVGGFDENFTPPVAYRFDNEFCKRLIASGGRILFEPSARIHHLRAARGGTRSAGSHMTSISPEHGVGDYYFALRCATGWERFLYLFKRPLREVKTKFHLRHPWFIPVKLVGEFRAVVLAFQLFKNGPRLLSWEEQ